MARKSANRLSYQYLSCKAYKLLFVVFLLQSYCINDALGFKIFGFDLSRLASLRAPPSRPSYQPRPSYQEIPEPPPPQIEQREEYAYRQPEYNSVYSDQFESSPQHDLYNTPVIEPQSYEEHSKIDYQYDYSQGETTSYDTQHYSNYRTNERQETVPESPPSPVYVPSQHSQPVVHSTSSAPSEYVNFYASANNQNPPEFSDYQELEIITAPTVKSKASVYGGQNTFDVKVGAGFHTSNK